jgi:hypothetical protein
MLLRKMWESASIEEADLYSTEQQGWCVEESVIKAIHESAIITLDLLKGNRISHPDEKGFPWWPPARVETSDDELLETRRIFLRSRAYDTGITYFLRELVRRNIIDRQTVGQPDLSEDENDYPWLEEMLLAQSFFGFNQMLAFARTKELFPNEYVAARNEQQTRLGEIAKLFGIAGPNRKTHFKKKKLMRFASVGFLTAKSSDALSEMTIELGPAGRAFFKVVYLPTINHMSIFAANMERGNQGG